MPELRSLVKFASPNAVKPADHFPIKLSLLAALGIVSGIAMEAWEYCINSQKWVC